MNDMTSVPRHRQAPITIRSDKAARLLAELTRDGRSQAQVIEEALEHAAHAAGEMSREEFMARIDSIVRPLRSQPRTTYRELREQYYDDDGLPR